MYLPVQYRAIPMQPLDACFGLYSCHNSGSVLNSRKHMVPLRLQGRKCTGVSSFFPRTLAAIARVIPRGTKDSNIQDLRQNTRFDQRFAHCMATLSQVRTRILIIDSSENDICTY